MTIDNFLENFADQLDITSAELLTPNTEFRTLDKWGSLAALSIIAMVDEEYGVAIDADDFMVSKTIQDLYNQVSKHL